MFELIPTDLGEQRMEEMIINSGAESSKFLPVLFTDKKPVVKCKTDLVRAKKGFKKDKNPYKKNTRKWYMYKMGKKVNIPNTVTNFHETRLPNIIFDLEEGLLTETSSEIKKGGVWKNKSCKILINCGYGLYRKISLKTYFKLMTLVKVRFEVECDVLVDGEEEASNIYADSITATSINGLISCIQNLEFMEMAVRRTQLQIAWYDIYNYTYRVMTFKRNGETKYYKSIDEFMSDYNIDFSKL